MTTAINDYTVTSRDQESKIESIQFDILSLKGDTQKTRYYTGFPTYEAVKSFVELMELLIQSDSRHSLSKSQMLFLTLVKLRHGFDFRDLGYRFNIS